MALPSSSSSCAQSVTHSHSREQVDIVVEDPKRDEHSTAASWATLPQEQQLALLVLAHFVETFAAGSLQSYVVFQLQSFQLADGSFPGTATVALQLSVLRAIEAASELVASMLWGVLADHPRVGRKCLVVLGLLMSGMASICMGFTRSFAGAVACYLLVGFARGSAPVLRSMVREVSGDRFESRAIVLLPATLNVASILGPFLGAFLAEDAVKAGKATGGWRSAWPFLLPNAVNGSTKLCCAARMVLQLQETLASGGRATGTPRHPDACIYHTQMRRETPQKMYAAVATLRIAR